ncbi:ATP-NAD kinase [Syntrophus aciditrophicus SB]|uniref:NAD kinase n=1 Tax=Syntrophus aciditrophicus (strain SB) TaxID=56780 RepID=Q2LSY0_SYNAS|nr:NAD(+)/NADH kinase [Syntrophus aciditrophicus]ABC77186.1 ATP-NAD kinase [Syntrophus aciditrophicus SB]
MQGGKRIKKIGIIANIRKEKALGCAAELKAWLLDQGMEVFLDEEIAGVLGEPGGMNRRSLAAQADLLIVLGGDGTMLRAARSVREFDIPIVGINLGAFGYLTDINLNEMYPSLERILCGNYATEKRMMLDMEVMRGGRILCEHTVLNDVVINRGNLSRIIDMETAVDDHYLTTFRADGLIISTPTGSTAYSLSAGGPIVFPSQDAIIINPICPHTLTNRPVILPCTMTVSVKIWSEDEGVNVDLDGQESVALKSGDILIIRRSRYMTTLVSSQNRDYLEILRSKLGWGRLPAMNR